MAIAVKVRGDNGHQTEKYPTFEEYITKRWEFSKRRGYQLLNAADLTQKIAQTSPDTLTKKDEKSERFVHKLAKKTTAILPETEWQIRLQPLSKLAMWQLLFGLDFLLNLVWCG